LNKEATIMRHSPRTHPQLEALESRALLSAGHAHHPIFRALHAHTDVFRFTIPRGTPTPPRTGGAAALVSPGVLLVVTNKPGNFLNNAVIQDDGAGNVTVEWNGHTPPTFHGVSEIFVDSRGKTGSVSFELTGNVTVAQTVDVQLDGTNSGASYQLGGFQTNGLLTFQLQTAPTPRNLAKGP
jgi:hypothetical protein